MVIYWWFYVTSQQETMGSNLLVSWGISAWTVSGVQTHVSWSLCLPGWLEQARGICCCFSPSVSLSSVSLARVELTVGATLGLLLAILLAYYSCLSRPPCKTVAHYLSINID